MLIYEVLYPPLAALRALRLRKTSQDCLPGERPPPGSARLCRLICLHALDRANPYAYFPSDSSDPGSLREFAADRPLGGFIYPRTAQGLALSFRTPQPGVDSLDDHR